MAAGARTWRKLRQRSRRVSKATGSRERAPDNRLRVPTIGAARKVVGTALRAFAHSTILRDPTNSFVPATHRLKERRLHRHSVNLVFAAHELDMCAHGGGRAGLVAAHDGDD